MIIRNSEATYGLVAKILHWAIALLILMMLVIGFTMVDLENGPDKLFVYGWHKSFGNLILMLVGIRIIWKLINIAPKPLPSHAPWERGLAHFIHLLLYAAMLGMPLSGWVMSSAGDFRNSFFGLFEMPDIVPKNEDLMETMLEVHEWIAFAIMGFIGLHVLGALKHHFIDKDETLQRMTARRVGFKAGAALTVVILAMGGVVALQAGNSLLEEFGEDEGIEQEESETERTVAVKEIKDSGGWIIDHEHSEIEFEATQYGDAFKGEFTNFGGTIIFDPADLSQARADITIDIASMSTGSADRDSQAKGADWFDTASFPQARFTADSFESAGEGQYIAHGRLDIRGVALPLDLPFSLRIESNDDGERADMEAEATLQRLDFGIGQGEWQATDVIGNPVKLSIKLRAAAAQ